MYYKKLNFFGEYTPLPLAKGGSPISVVPRMSPLGVAHWKIEFIPRSGELPPTVTQRMSPLGVAQWKIKFAARSASLPPTVV